MMSNIWEVQEVSVDNFSPKDQYFFSSQLVVSISTRP